eukprot:NODE_241_length_13209_cov_0.424256.p2 type:complete len:310 gc:universal NODE_241_length_13209_cov_0.424256:5611-4682(-)
MTQETAFRAAEKLHQHNNIDVKNEILASNQISLRCTLSDEVYIGEMQLIQSPLPGCLLIRNALSTLEQQHMLYNSIVTYPNQFPTVLEKDYELGDGIDIFKSYQLQDEVLIKQKQFQGICPVTNRPYARKQIKNVPSHTLLKKLRWTILGREFDWVNRKYTATSYPIPALINSATQKIVKASFPYTKYDSIHIEAGVVNYYKQCDRMMAHVDLSESNMEVPLCSFSLGATGVLLMGTKDRKDPPVAVEMRSGDALLMYGECRYAYHGVPKIRASDFSKLENCDLLDYNDVFKFLKDNNMRININIRQID